MNKILILEKILFYIFIILGCNNFDLKFVIL